MAQNLFEKVYNHFKAYYNNGYNLLKKLRDVYFGGPQDVTLQWQDPETGEIHNLVVPSFAKMRDRFISDVNSVMAKTIYVDAENGSDETGDGSSSAPFKTLEKAINSVPEGGYGHIYVKGEHIISALLIKNKSIYIEAYGEATIKPKIYTRKAGQTTYYEYIGFILQSHASLYIYVLNSANTKLELMVDNIDEQYSITPHSGFIVVSEGATSASCHILIRTFVDNRNPIYIGRRAVLFSINEWAVDRPAHVSFSLSGHYSGENRHIVLDGDLANLKSSPASLYVNYTGGFKDSAGNSIDIKTKIKGIVKDSNGIPRNVISNIIF